jgi:hypothetical protein
VKIIACNQGQLRNQTMQKHDVKYCSIVTFHFSDIKKSEQISILDQAAALRKKLSNHVRRWTGVVLLRSRKKLFAFGIFTKTKVRLQLELGKDDMPETWILKNENVLIHSKKLNKIIQCDCKTGNVVQSIDTAEIFVTEVSGVKLRNGNILFLARNGGVFVYDPETQPALQFLVHIPILYGSILVATQLHDSRILFVAGAEFFIVEAKQVKETFTMPVRTAISICEVEPGVIIYHSLRSVEKINVNNKSVISMHQFMNKSREDVTFRSVIRHVIVLKNGGVAYYGTDERGGYICVWNTNGTFFALPFPRGMDECQTLVEVEPNVIGFINGTNLCTVDVEKKRIRDNRKAPTEKEIINFVF